MEPNKPWPQQVLEDQVTATQKALKKAGSQRRRELLDNFYTLLFNTDTALVNNVIKGDTKRWLSGVVNEDIAEIVEEPVELTPPVKASVKQLLDVIEQLNQANKHGTPDDKEVALNLALMAVTDCLGDPNLGTLVIKGEKLPDFLQNVIGSQADECNNILSSTVKPYLLDLYTGIPQAIRVKRAFNLK